MNRVLAIDPGDRRIGIALSDPTQTIASPLMVIKHRSREEDARAIVELAMEQEVFKIVVGVPYDANGQIGPQARKAMRLLAAIKANADVPVIPWDESYSTLEASRTDSVQYDVDAVAAAHILQDYLDAGTD